MNILEALNDPKLLAASPAFRDPAPWAAWRAFVAATYGLALDGPGERAFLQATSLPHYSPPAGGWREVVAVVGRQAGKTRLASALVAYEAATAPPCRDGEVYAVLLAQDHRSAMRTAFSYLRSLFGASPLLSRLVVRETSDTLELENGVRVAAYPCRPAAIRGLRAVVAVVDELAYFISTDGRPTDTEMLRAVRPTLATTGGRLVILSSPYGQSGALWDLHRRHHGREGADVLVWQADAPTMNPTLPRDYLDRMRQDDPEAYRSEVLGQFRAGLSTLLDPDALDACVGGHRELPPRDGVAYKAFVDPSGGRRDAFTAAVGHREGEVRVVDAVRAWTPPFNPEGATEECAEWLRGYGVREVVGDRFAGEWPREAFRKHGLAYRVADKDRSALYLALLPVVYAGQARLPRQDALLRELRGLERRRGPSGRDRVDHRPGAHDDLANAVAGLVELLRPKAPFVVSGGTDAPSAEDVAALVRAGGGAWMPGDPL